MIERNPDNGYYDWVSTPTLESGPGIYGRGKCISLRSSRVGKTYVAVALMREKISGDNEAIFTHPDGVTKVYVPAYPRMISVPDLLLEIRECFSGRTGDSESSLIEKYAGKKCLILDDLGVEQWQKMPVRIPGPLLIIINPCAVDPSLSWCGDNGA